MASEEQITSLGETFPEMVKRLDEGIASGISYLPVEWKGLMLYSILM